MKYLSKYRASKFRILMVLGGFCILCMGGLIFIYIAKNIGGAYSINEVILTNDLDENGRPIQELTIFKPTEPIVAYVSTTGAEGIIGMRWYFEDELIYEVFGKTENNQIDSYIQSSPSVTLPEGNYRVDIGIGQTPEISVDFIVEQYKPDVVPIQPTPINHKEIEHSAFVEVPFAFDETWVINDNEWTVNEVKVTFIKEDVFVSIAVETNLNLAELSEEQAIAITKPIANYAVKSGYLEQAESLQIDGTHYNLDKKIYVNLVNRDLSISRFEESGKPVFRIGFDTKVFLDPEG